ncbi:hypothetical protein BDY24DRAFT_383506 [Mrakia frigida]|uniref:uncharacterized protein n=1 Tax=Mrakia frigida TaxID=29902 RepID=UPI003FCC2435
MAPRSNTRLFTAATCLFLFLVLALWTSPPSFSPSSWSPNGEEDEGVWEAEKLDLDKAFELPSFEGTLTGEGSLEGDAGVGQGEEETKEGGAGKVELDEEMIVEGSTPSNSSLTTLPSPKTPNRPSFPPLLPEQLSTLRQDYLARLNSMESFSFGQNYTHNERMLVNLVNCLEEGELGAGRCATEVPRVVAVTEIYFVCGLDHCDTTGEVIWLAPVAVSLERQGYYSLVIDDSELLPLWKTLGDMVTQVWMQDQALIDCVGDQKNCVESWENPSGIPAWKLFALTFWGSIPGADWWSAPQGPWSFNPLGSEWTLTPYPMPDNHTYLGYNFEGCTDTPVVPPSERSNTLFVLSKYLEYFHSQDTWPQLLYSSIVNATGLEIITSAKGRDDNDPNELPAGVKSVGRLSKEDYSLTVGSAKVLLGIGMPHISPSPYAALCQGVPVILPSFNSSNPLPLGWSQFSEPPQHQHAIAAQIGPPYVYSIDLHGPIQDLIDTIKMAVETPIGRYVPPEMTPEALDARVRTLLSTNWEEVARKRMVEKGWDGVRLPKHLKGKVSKEGRFRGVAAA